MPFEGVGYCPVDGRGDIPWMVGVLLRGGCGYLMGMMATLHGQCLAMVHRLHLLPFGW